MTAVSRGHSAILGLRLRRQLIEARDEPGEAENGPAEVVRHLGAMQAQDYPGVLWSVGQRSAATCTAADVERALADRLVVRTWPMRGTLHLVAPENVRWMLALLTPRVLARARRRHEELGVTAEVVGRAREILTDALAGGHALTRADLLARLEAGSIDTSGEAGYHVLWTLAQLGLVCCGPMEGKQQTFVLLDEWIPPAEDAPVTPATALAALAALYFGARCPATTADFAWWAGITKAEAKAGIDGAGTGLRRVVTGDSEYWLPAGIPDPAETDARTARQRVHLLPGFDEYFLGYADRSLQTGDRAATYGATTSANGMFSPTVIANGRIAGTWRRTLRRDRVDIAVRAFRELTRTEHRSLASAAERYGRFVGLSANFEVDRG